MEKKTKEEKKEATLKLIYERNLEGFTYKTSEDPIQVGDYYYDFQIDKLYGHPIKRCDNQRLADLMNAYYAKTKFHLRHSAKIIATNNPELNADGVPKY